MQYLSEYKSPIGKIIIATDEKSLIGIWFADQKYFATTIDKKHEKKETKIIIKTKEWLDIYFKRNQSRIRTSNKSYR